MSAKYFRADPSNPRVQSALRYNHLSSVPANWVIDTSGNLRTLDPDGSLNMGGASLVPTDEQGTLDMPFWKQVLHAAPYALALGGAGALAGGLAGAGAGAAGEAAGAGTAGALGPTTAATMAATEAASAAPAGIAGLAGTAGTAAAGGSGILSALGKGAAAAKSGSSIWNSLSGLGADAGALAVGRADARQAEAAAQQRQDQLAMQRYQAGLQGAQTDLAQRRFGLEAPGQRAGNAVRGDILANAQDVSFSGLPDRLVSKIPTISGGLRPSIFSPATRQLGGLMSSQALSGQQAGDTFAPIGQPPELTPLPSGNAFDTALTTGGTLATLGSDLGPSFLDYLSRYRKSVPQTSTPSFLGGDSGPDTAGFQSGY